ncbi:hypothetical protein FQN51_003738 [Onygenales sp. PD_10]|nr:hypothetical protein FQN51_003738 [Onygenales sp. PD_10]
MAPLNVVIPIQLSASYPTPPNAVHQQFLQQTNRNKRSTKEAKAPAKRRKVAATKAPAVKRNNGGNRLKIERVPAADLAFYHFSAYLRLHLPEPDDNNERVVGFTKNANYELPSRAPLSAYAMEVSFGLFQTR